MKKNLAILAILVVAVLGGLFLMLSDSNDESTIRLATTTSTEDSGLLNELLPVFEQETGYKVQVIAMGTGQAIETARRGDADILLAHATDLEKQFVEDGYGAYRYSVMYNDFILAGPANDPANVESADSLEEALRSIEDHKSLFNSRGDDSGTHIKEQSLWNEAGVDIPQREWYNSLGQGMGETLITSNEMGAYTLADRGTYLSMSKNIPNLKIVFEGDERMFNPYGIIPVSPERFDNVNYEGASALADFFIRDDVQEMIGEFGKDEFGQPLFFPDANPEEANDYRSEGKILNEETVAAF
ncbi:extracellular solute-binding protein family 1 [Methanosalsum zhilinae DSM 4017]|uniref:Extracellular solute-binding protein family 1 n=1 Tax=Methanosalsum zhilinae (strain DSM 4017 / NBRC 107636 / OCM 62 / WeN5) TaxID=679901 RepID=F7XQL6_METZD|nr:substrate-binding domain-containing protein [Methanosalsum zhilinae]AEH61615.1 extracellular solute-binding protein family 1 [Methanosalsum zhilinae DSM 4017]